MRRSASQSDDMDGDGVGGRGGGSGDSIMMSSYAVDDDGVSNADIGVVRWGNGEEGGNGGIWGKG